MQNISFAKLIEKTSNPTCNMIHWIDSEYIWSGLICAVDESANENEFPIVLKLAMPLKSPYTTNYTVLI